MLNAVGLLYLVPVAALVVGGTVVAARRWHRHPEVSTLTIVGLVLSGSPFAASLLYPFIPTLSQNSDGGIDPVDAVVAISAITSFVALLGIGLLLLAALGWRAERSGTRRSGPAA